MLQQTIKRRNEEEAESTRGRLPVTPSLMVKARARVMDEACPPMELRSAATSSPDLYWRLPEVFTSLSSNSPTTRFAFDLKGFEALTCLSAVDSGVSHCKVIYHALHQHTRRNKTL